MRTRHGLRELSYLKAGGRQEAGRKPGAIVGPHPCESFPWEG